jgi:hypothetical protein
MRALLLSDPRVGTTSVKVLKACWSVVTELYGLADREAKEAFLRHPLLLSRQSAPPRSFTHSLPLLSFTDLVLAEWR